MIRARKAVGCFFLWTSGVHVGIVAADTSLYRAFADEALVPFVERAWRDVFMAAPVFWGLMVAAGELALGLLLLAGGRAAQLGWLGVIAFNVALMLFGWGFWLWSVPVTVILAFAARRDWPRLRRGTETSAGSLIT